MVYNEPDSRTAFFARRSLFLVVLGPEARYIPAPREYQIAVSDCQSGKWRAAVYLGKHWFGA